MRIILGAVGGMIAVGIASALGVGGAFEAIVGGVGLGCGWLVYGLLVDRNERTRIARDSSKIALGTNKNTRNQFANW